MGPRPSTRFFSTFGWSLIGSALLAFSFTPMGFYPIAWVALVPILSRWACREASWAYARELYAVFLMTSCLAGFWLLFHPDTGQAIRGGLGLFLIPLPFVAAFISAAVVRARRGLGAGLAMLAANVLAFEYLLIHSPVHAPWLLLGHTQATATLFNQMADVGGVLLLSAWVLGLNVAVFTAVPSAASVPTSWLERMALVLTDRPGVRGFAVAVLSLLLALPMAYSVHRVSGLDAVTGYLRVGLVQPNMNPREWADPGAKSRVAYLAELSNGVVRHWQGQTYLPDSSRLAQPVSLTTSARSDTPSGLLVWPQGALPHLGSRDRQRDLVDRLDGWTERLNVGLLAGAETLENAESEPVQTAVFLAPSRDPASVSQQKRSPLFDGPAGDALSRSQTPFPFGRTRIASVVGFESLYGDYARDAVSGADVLVVLAKTDQWGHSPGIYQHLAFTRLRAIETRRAVVLSSVRGVSALIHPDGSTERVADWRDQGVVSLDVPILQKRTLYSRWGDWVGLFGLGLALVANLGVLGHARFGRPPAPRRTR
ncbi:MAG: nitrilase-related carbon-nitrogen hydrolase [Bacteroidota bacterium]